MLKAKLAKKNGFTLVEMLIVVAIIAILVAVSIPLVGTALDKAKKATDDANMRSAKAEATIMYFNEQMGASGAKELEVGMIYDNVQGTFVKGTTVEPYSKTEQKDKDDAKVEAGNGYITVTNIDHTSDTIFTLNWTAKPKP